MTRLPTKSNTWRRGDVIVPPPLGSPLLINPRQEDPLEYLELDLLGTFIFQAQLDLGSLDAERAQYTIDVLKLNREIIRKARENAYHEYRSTLAEYIRLRDEHPPYRHPPTVVDALKRKGHPSVWQEMKRTHLLIHELRTLFSEAPEALEW